MKHYTSFFLKYIFLIFFVLQSSSVIYSQDKKVLWIHGLGDATGEPNDIANISGWQERYAEEFARDRKMSSKITNYKETTKSGVQQYANDIAENQFFPNTNEANIGIGHSMGGMALRHIDVHNSHNKRFKGIVTFASPLTGANIISDVPATSRFIEQSIYNIARPVGWVGPVVGAGMVVLGKLLMPLSAKNGSDLIIAGGAVTIGSLAINVFAGLPGPLIAYISDGIANKRVEKKAPSNGITRGDLSENSSYVKEFDNSQTSTPLIHVWGNEHNPVGWRMLSTAVAGKDQSDLTTAVSIYADVCNVMQYIGGWYATPVGYSLGEAYEWFRPDGRGNAAWVSEIVKASHTQRQTVGYWSFNQWSHCYVESQTQSSQKCNRWGWFGWLCKAVTSVFNYFKCVWVTVKSWVVKHYDRLVLDPSDGTVTEWSAKGQYRPDLSGNKQTQAWSRNAITIEANGVNHSEFRNHPEMTTIFNNKIWSGNPNGGRAIESSVFYVPSR